MTKMTGELTSYKMEDLVPLVLKLAEKYTSKESSSISYHTTEVLMEAVVYCIHHGQGNSHQAYESGYKAVIDKVMECKKIYETIFDEFDSYENKAYFDTVIHGIPGFFMKYDAKFQPQNAILTFDYPTLIDPGKMEGVDAVYAYLEAVRLEQMFLGKIQRQLIIELLYRYHPEYKNLFVNTVVIVLRTILGSMMIGKKETFLQIETQDLEAIKKYLENKDEKTLESEINGLIKILVDHFYDGNRSLIQYLTLDSSDFSICLLNGAKYNSLKSIFP